MTQWLTDIKIVIKPGKKELERCTFTIKAHEESWKNQRRKRREEQRGPSTKRPRTEELEKEGEEEKKKEVFLCCRVTLLLVGEDRVGVEIVFLSGKSGKDGVHQLVQFMKNKTKGL